MIFSSVNFLFFFLPASVGGFFLLSRVSRTMGAAWLLLASVFFYGLWSPAHVLLLAFSILVNYGLGLLVTKNCAADGSVSRRKLFMLLGVCFNISLLVYYKYSNFLLQTSAAWLGTPSVTLDLVFPLGISFFTFTQISFLVDAYYKRASECSLLHYGLFVTFFPHLLAGPILHHKEMMPQFRQDDVYRVNWTNINVGLTIFFIGLFKKTVLADGIAVYVPQAFSAAAQGQAVGLLDAWCGALAYTLQLYFDFSGYSDMAIGMSRLVGIRLPLNFHSPYKALNIIDFWQRWHMTLSRFLRDYIYFPLMFSRISKRWLNVPLAGNPKWPANHYVCIVLTMTIAGMWHGAGWTFILFGLLHGLLLSINHAWHGLRSFLGHGAGRPTVLGGLAARTLTFCCVVVSLVIFRAEGLDALTLLLQGLAGLGPGGGGLYRGGFASGGEGMLALGWIVCLLALVWLPPNTQQIMADADPALGMPREKLSGRLYALVRWKPGLAWGVATMGVALLGILSVIVSSSNPEFLYFQF